MAIGRPCESRSGRLDFGLPNAVYRTTDGRLFDLVALGHPDIPARVFADDDVAASRNPGTAAATQTLGKK